jgi:hypothetical protein
MKPRISIAQILALIVPIAVALAAITNPSGFWEGTILLLTLLVLFTAIVGAIYRKEAERAFWLGIVVFGWGLYLLGSGFSFEFQPMNPVRNGYSRVYWNQGGEDERPIHALVKTLVDHLQLERRFQPKAVGEKIQVQWGGAGSYFPSSVLEIKDGKYKIRYENDNNGVWDEWVGLERIRLLDLDRSYRIGESLFSLFFALAGGVIALLFYTTTRKGNRSEAGSRGPIGEESGHASAGNGASASRGSGP